MYVYACPLPLPLHTPNVLSHLLDTNNVQKSIMYVPPLLLLPHPAFFLLISDTPTSFIWSAIG